MATSDFTILGAGVVGLSTAWELAERFPGSKITIVDKEPQVAMHGSGRNSGVLHAGFYYTADSMKARFTRLGNHRWKDFARTNGLRLRECGKLVVARSEQELAGLDELKRRGDANGVQTQLIDEKEAREIDPCAKTFDRALWSPTTATVDPRECMRALVEAVKRKGVELRLDAPYGERDGRRIRAGGQWIDSGFVINAAGLQADRIAHDFGFGREYRILPFKGIYLYGDADWSPLRVHVYPVPDLKKTFLGVHFTVTVDGLSKIGPTAIPALWREQYKGLGGFMPGEFVSILRDQLRLFVANEIGFRQLAWEEVRKYSKRFLAARAGELVQSVALHRFRRWGPAGIRAQLYDHAQRRLVMDFVVEADRHSLHVLNAISPAFTAAMPFASHLVDEIERQLGHAKT
ncbi:MAG: FAD-dependent oxidoreductase [Acidobacteriota bacterium]